MSNKRLNTKPRKQPKQKPITSLLDLMKDGREFESILPYKVVNIDITKEIRKSLKEIQEIRNRPVICYIANVVNTGVKASKSIDYTDDLPFSEMISVIPDDHKELDILLVTPGGSGEQVAKFVDKLRPRFDDVTFILPYMAMSAGTIFAMSGNDIIMDKNSYIGPTDPQVPNRDGVWVPAQAILSLIDRIKKDGEALLRKGQNPSWTDLQILKQIDGKEIGNAINASKYSMELVEEYLYNYKFKNWQNHSTDNRIVTDDEKQKRAKSIAEKLCSHKQWKTHSRGISRDVAWNECQIKITHAETIENLDRAIRRFWALIYWIFENTAILKAFISDSYCVFRNDKELMK